jgi:16S rRNA processing protein RimM
VNAGPVNAGPVNAGAGSAGQPDGTDDGWVALAEVARPHGIRGELRLKVYNPDSDLLSQKPAIRLRRPGRQPEQATLTTARAVPGALLVRLRGIDSREKAEALRGVQVEVERHHLETPNDDDEFYVVDLIGCRALVDGEELGEVVDVVAYPTCEVLVIERAAATLPEPEEAEEGARPRRRGRRRRPRIEVPMQGSYVGRVDTDEKTIEILTIEDLD